MRVRILGRKPAKCAALLTDVSQAPASVIKPLSASWCFRSVGQILVFPHTLLFHTFCFTRIEIQFQYKLILQKKMVTFYFPISLSIIPFIHSSWVVITTGSKDLLPSTNLKDPDTYLPSGFVQHELINCSVCWLSVTAYMKVVLHVL